MRDIVSQVNSQTVKDGHTLPAATTVFSTLPHQSTFP
jgi:hypothetical protein